MPEFQHTSIDRAGKNASGRITAETEQQATEILRAKGLYPSNIKEIKPKGSWNELTPKKFKLKDLALFCRQLSAILNAGITVLMALDILYQQTEKKVVKDHVKKLYETLQKGEQLSTALKAQGRVYPELMISMVEAGEASGMLEKVIGKLALTFEVEVKLRSKVKGAMTYPIILCVLTVLVIVILSTMVLPTFAGMFKSMEMSLPLPTKIMMGFSDFMINQWYIAFSVPIILGFAIIWYVRTENGRRQLDQAKLKIPVSKKIVVRSSAVRFSRTLSILTASGISLLVSLEIAANVLGNVVISENLRHVREEVRKGMSLSQSLRAYPEVFPPMLIAMVNIGEESGAMEDLLEKTSVYYEEEVENAISGMVSMIEPLMIVTLAGIVGFVIISIMMPIMEMYNAAQGSAGG